MFNQSCKTEAKLFHLLEHESQLRASNYCKLQELPCGSRKTKDKASVMQAGRLFLRPLKHANGAGYKRQKMDDVIAFSDNIGVSDFFIAIMCKHN